MDVVTNHPATVSSNSVPMPFDDELFAPLPDSTALLSDPAALRTRLREDGVLYLRGVLDRAEILRLRADYFAGFPAGYLEPGTAPAAGIYSGATPSGLPAHGMPGHPAHAFVRGARLQRFLEQPALTVLAGTLLDGPAVRLPRVILRHFDFRSGRSSRAHTDHTYMDRGTETVITMWLPIGDCPVESGGLVYLDGSQRIDPDALRNLRSVTDRPGDDRPLSHDLGWVARSLGRRWLWADYRAGDIAVHGPHIVHASLDTATPAMRMSLDVRFGAAGQPLDPRWLRPWSADDGA